MSTAMTKAEKIAAKQKQRAAKYAESLISSIEEQDSTTYSYKAEARMYPLDEDDVLQEAQVESPLEDDVLQEAQVESPLENQKEDLQIIKTSIKKVNESDKCFCKWCNTLHL